MGDVVKKRGDAAPSDPGRRKTLSFIVRAALAWAALGAFFGLRGARGAPAGFRGKYGVIRPPGSLDEEQFLAKCIRCQKCAQACETHCILYFGPEAGKLDGTPYILPRNRGCNLCMKCGKSCPTGAIKPMEKTDKKQVLMGSARVDKRLCLPHTNSGVCGACFTACVFRNKAITQGIRLAPEMHEEHCVGCGMCEQVCIVDDRPAIIVYSDRVYSDPIDRKFHL